MGRWRWLTPGILLAATIVLAQRFGGGGRGGGFERNQDGDDWKEAL